MDIVALTLDYSIYIEKIYLSYLKYNSRTLLFIENILNLHKRINSNSEQRLWNIVLRKSRLISVYYLNISLYCNGALFYLKKHRHFFDDINSISLIFSAR